MLVFGTQGRTEIWWYVRPYTETLGFFRFGTRHILCEATGFYLFKDFLSIGLLKGVWPGRAFSSVFSLSGVFPRCYTRDATKLLVQLNTRRGEARRIGFRRFVWGRRGPSLIGCFAGNFFPLHQWRFIFSVPQRLCQVRRGRRVGM